MFDAGWWATRAKFDNPGQVNPTMARWFLRLCAPLLRLFHRPSITGLEHIPRQGPFVLVSNHSGGMAISEIACLTMLWLRHLRNVPLAALAHPVSFHLWPLTAIMRAVGAVPSSYQAAATTLQAGVGVLIFPGGDHEAARPMWQAFRVDFNQRKGFLRIAKAAGVPLVPMGIRGSHLSVPILARTRFLAWAFILPRLFGIKRYPLTLAAVLGATLICVVCPTSLGWPWTIALCWLWVASPLSLLPWIPTTIRFRVGKPMAPAELFAHEDLSQAYQLVQERIQSLVDRR